MSRDRPKDPALAQLLVAPAPPSLDELERKKLLLCMKMDRLERQNRARTEFTKIINENNWEKEKMLLSKTEADFLKASQTGLKQVEQVFDKLHADHVRRKSLPKRLQIIHDYCTVMELQEGHGLVKKEDLPTLPHVDANDVLPFGYKELLTNQPPPVEFTASELLAVGLLQPYQMPPQFSMVKKRRHD